MTIGMDVSLSDQEQVLRFDEEVVPVARGFLIPDSFYEKGYCVVPSVARVEDAAAILQSIVSGVDSSRAPLFAHFAGRTRLAKRDRIPVCEPSVQTSFSALHIDHAQPLVADSPQLMQTLVGLYCPSDSVDASAKTRVVSLASLFSQRKFGSQEEVASKLTEYVTMFGDGWTEPSKVNTKRIACFGRVIDALAGGKALLEQWNQRMDEWFFVADDASGMKGLSRERAFYIERGIDLTKCEDEIVLRPGELLILDNLRAIHGRLGKRERAEIWQFMFGVKDATPADVDVFRDWIVKQASK